MKLLIRPTPFTDESLESYLLRLCQANHYDNLGVLIAAMVNSFPKLNAIFAGSLPTDLHSINVCHANHSSAKRYRALMELAELTGCKGQTIQELILFRSPQQFSAQHQAVIYQGKLIPRLFLREQAVPVCPDCLRDEPYIRQLWHFNTYHVCHIHNKQLVKTCPECNAVVDYRSSFAITSCLCGYDLREYVAPDNEQDYLLGCANLLAGEVTNVPAVLRDKSTSQRFGALLWWWLEKCQNKNNSIDEVNLRSFFEYFDSWPQSIINDLEQRKEAAALVAVVQSKDRKFNKQYGDLLLNAAKLPARNLSANFILREVVNWLSVQQQGEIARRFKLLQINFIEAAILLNTTTTEVYRLMEEGYLKTHCRIKMGEPISFHNTVFRLGDVFDLWISGFQTEHSNIQHFLSKW